MPKDNEVDEKVTPVAWMTRKALENFAKHRSGNADAAASSYAYAMEDDDCFEPLYSAATVAELRAEVERLVKALDEAACELSAAGQALAEFEGFEFRQKAATDRAYAASQKAHDANGYTEALTGADPT